MRVIRKQKPAGRRVIALGTFDGVHRGHQSLIRIAKEEALEKDSPLRVCTFDHHPLEILQPDNPPEMLSTIPEKASEMLKLGADEMDMIPFNRRTARLEPEMFLERLRCMTDVCAVVAGWNYTFGRYGKGDAELLSADGKKHGYKVIIVPPETWKDGTAISSSLIRQKLREGKTEEAAELLGREYTLTGTVVSGKHEGRNLGFPTANIEPWKRKALPMYGVYICTAEKDNKKMPAIVNIGVQPTIPSGKVTIEVHILDQTFDIYKSKVRLTLLKMLRKEKKFDSLQKLQTQIEKDCEEARKWFGMA